MPEDYKIEDTVICIDMSRSMLRKDFKPNRLSVALETIKNFVQTKLAIDPKDQISIISFGDGIRKLHAFSRDEEQLIKSIKDVQISGKGSLQDAIAFSLQILVEEMRKIGGKIYRIFIISDDKLKVDDKKLQQMIKITKGLGIFVDSCQLGKTQDYRQSTLKRIAQITGGEYGFFNNSRAIITAGKAFASKKNVSDSNEFYSDKKKEIPPLVNEIALPLRRPTVMEIRLMMRGGGRGQDKCQICHSIKAPLTDKDFYSEGRYCSNCDRAMHISCAAEWAKKSEYTESVFRCPFCYFLLELPKSALKILKAHKDEIEEEPLQKIRILEDDEGNVSTMILVPDEQVENIDASCSFCNNIFLGEHEVFQCEKCDSYYHKPCLKKMYDDIKACRFCGKEFKI